MKKLIFLLALLFPLFTAAQVRTVFKELGHWRPANLPSIGTETFSDLWGWAGPDSREYAIIGSVDSIYFIEVTDPTHPILRDAKAGRVSHCVHRDEQTYGHYCYAVAGEGASSLQIFDLQYLPDSVHKVYDSDSICVTSHAIFIGNSRLYFCTHTMKGENIYALSVASLSNPEKPVLIGHLIPPMDPISGPSFYYVHDMYARGDTTYLSCQDKGLFIYDFRDSMKPKLIGSIQSYPQGGFNHSNWLSPDGNNLVFTDELKGKALKICDVSILKKGPSFSFICNTFGYKNQLGTMAHNPYIRDTIAYISYYEEGVVAFSIANANQPGFKPRFLAEFSTYPQGEGKYDSYNMNGCWGLYPFLPSGNILASDETNGLFILRLDTCSNCPAAINSPIFIAVDWSVENPFHQKLNIRFRLEKPENISIELFDLTGKKIYKTQAFADAGSNHFSYLLPFSLAAGFYELRFTATSFYKTIKLVKE